jgi:hypothetical protein
MWSRRRETQAEVSNAEAQPQTLVSAVTPLGTVTPETVAIPSLSAEVPSPGAGHQQAPAADTPANGAAVQAPPPALDEKTQQFWRGKLAAANFGGVVSLFTRSPAHRHYTMADLEWCLLPALALNQLMTAEAKLPDDALGRRHFRCRRL